MNVANESVGLVIGKQGATIKQLEQQSGARIQIAKECPAGSNMRPITVSGPPASVEQATSLILQKVSGVMPFFFTPPPRYAEAARVGGRGGALEGGRFVGVWRP